MYCMKIDHHSNLPRQAFEALIAKLAEVKLEQLSNSSGWFLVANEVNLEHNGTLEDYGH